jgi:hypothetical protein
MNDCLKGLVAGCAALLKVGRNDTGRARRGNSELRGRDGRVRGEKIKRTRSGSGADAPPLVMLGLGPSIHEFYAATKKLVAARFLDGRAHARGLRRPTPTMTL